MPYAAGWSAVELVALANLAKQIYEFYRDAPEGVRALLVKFEYVCRELNILSTILCSSGWPVYHEAPNLRNDLVIAKAYFERYQALANHSGSLASRAWHTTRLAFDRKKVTKIEKCVDDHLCRMDRFKLNAILVSSLLPRTGNAAQSLTVTPCQSPPQQVDDSIISPGLILPAEPSGQHLLLLTYSTSSQSDSLFSIPYGINGETSSLRSLTTANTVPVPETPVVQEFLQLTGWVAILAPSHIARDQILCKLAITATGDSICIRASIELSRPQSSVRYLPHLMSAPGTGGFGIRRTFCHIFSAKAPPFPHVLHPSLEGPEIERSAPYMILFHEPQFLIEEGSTAARRPATDLRYIFSSEDDRNLVRRRIFGKNLLNSAGTESICFGHIACLQRNISLWEEDDADRTKMITFYGVPPENRRSRADVDLEYRIIGAKNARKTHTSSSDKSLSLIVTKATKGVSVGPGGQASGMPDGPSTSGLSMPSFLNVISESTVCTILFSNDGDKIRYRRHLLHFMNL